MGEGALYVNSSITNLGFIMFLYISASRSYCSSGPFIVPVSLYSACEIAWHMCEKRFVAVCGVLSVTTIVQVFSSGTRWHYRGTDPLLHPVSYSVPCTVCASCMSTVWTHIFAFPFHDFSPLSQVLFTVSRCHRCIILSRRARASTLEVRLIGQLPGCLRPLSTLIYPPRVRVARWVF